MASCDDGLKKPSGNVGSWDSEAMADAAVGTVEEFGYEQQYRRVFKTLASVSLVLAMASPLSAIFITGIYSISYGGYWGLTWGWLIPGLLCFPQAIAIAELASSMPINGVYYWWTAALAPRAASRPMSFIFGWFNILAACTSMASFAWATGSSYCAVIPMLQPEWVPTNAQTMAISMGFIVFWSLCNLIGMERIGSLYMLIAGFVILFFIIFIIALPVTHAQLGLPFTPASRVFGEYTNFSEWDPAVAVPFSWFCAVWSITGWPAPAMMAEETVDAPKTVPKSIVVSYSASLGLGFIVCIVIAFCLDDLPAAAADETGFPIYSMIIAHWGSRLGTAFILACASTVALGGSSLLLTTASQVAAFSRDGGLPAASYFATVHQGTNMPFPAIGLIAIGATLILIFGLSTEASTIIYSLAVVALYITYAIPIALRIFANERFVPGPFYLGRMSKPVHIWALLSIFYITIILSFPTTPGWTVETFNYNWVVTLGLLLLCALAWFVGGKKNYRGPDLDVLSFRPVLPSLQSGYK